MNCRGIWLLLILHLLGCAVWFAVPALSQGIDLWDRINTLQSDMQYKYTWSQFDPNKYWNTLSTSTQKYYPTISDLTYKYSNWSYADPSKYWNPMSTISQGHYPTMSDLTYKYTMSTTSLKYTMQPDLNLKNTDMLPHFWNQGHSLPPLSQNYTYGQRPMTNDRYILPPIIVNHWHPDKMSTTSGTLDLPPMSMNLPYSRMDVGSNQWRSYPDYSSRVPDPRDLWTQRKLESDMLRGFGFLTSLASFASGAGPLMWVRGVGLGASTVELLSDPTGPAYEVAEGAGVAATLIDAGVDLLDERYFGPTLGAVSLLSSQQADAQFTQLKSSAITTVDFPYRRWNQMEPLGSRVAIAWGSSSQTVIRKYYNDPSWLPNESKLGAPDYLAGTYVKMVTTNEVSHYYVGPSVLTPDINSYRARPAPLRPLDLSTLPPQTQGLISNNLIGSRIAQDQFTGYLSSLRSPSVNNWLSRMSRMPTMNSFFSSSFLNSWHNSMLNFQNYWSYSPQWSGYGLGGRWR